MVKDIEYIEYMDKEVQPGDRRTLGEVLVIGSFYPLVIPKNLRKQEPRENRVKSNGHGNKKICS